MDFRAKNDFYAYSRRRNLDCLLNWSEIDLLAIVNGFGLTTFGQTAISRVGRNDSARIKRIYYSRLFYQKVHHYNYVKTKNKDYVRTY
jgi:hypothetical protein